MVNRKNIVITGIKGGVGSSISELFVNKNWNVLGIARIEQAPETETLHYYNLDIRRHLSVANTFKNISNMYGNIDVLVNNAAVFQQQPFENFTKKQISKIIDTNVKGTMYCTLEYLKHTKKGRIINIGSVSGLHGIKEQSVYSASKHAINGFFDSLAQEIGPNIKVCTINPGGIDTPLWNDKNPYSGDVSKLIKPSTIAKMVEYVVDMPDDCVVKNITVFPDCEWH
jgi:NADP-dependent 3-hydroxy acid dehydrogenase YdfG